MTGLFLQVSPTRRFMAAIEPRQRDYVNSAFSHFLKRARARMDACEFNRGGFTRRGYNRVFVEYI